MKILRFIIFLLLFQLSNNIAGQLANQPHTFRIYLDNDFLNFRGSGTDRYFTNGIRIDYFYAKQRKPKVP
jgi:hypothetical protein